MPEAETTELTERQQFWLRHLRACDLSGQTSIDYARAHDIKVKSLYAARKALAEKGALPPPPLSATNGFQRVRVVEDRRAMERQWHIQLPNGLAVSFDGKVDAATLSLILTTAATLS
jgi:hypothetical protein